MKKMLLEGHLKPIERESMAEKVVNRILGLIKAGNLKAGDKLPSEKELAAVFNVSRPTLREALQALSILGITSTRKGGGCYVSALKAKDLLGPLEFFLAIDDGGLDDIFECRIILECEMVAKAAENVTSTELETLEQLIVFQRGAVDDPIAFRISDQKFHELLATISGNAVLARLSDGMYNMAMDVRRRAVEIEGVIAQSIDDHQAIVDGLRSKNPVAAASAMKRHLMNVKHTTILALK